MNDEESQLRLILHRSSLIVWQDVHASIMAGTYALGSSADQDRFTTMLIRYQLHGSESDGLDAVADACDRRVAWGDLPLDLVAAYESLSRLARWRAAQLRGGL